MTKPKAKAPAVRVLKLLSDAQRAGRKRELAEREVAKAEREVKMAQRALKRAKAR
jgi:hypothetical protein